MASGYWSSTFLVFFLYGEVTPLVLVLEGTAEICDLNLNLPNFSYLICKIIPVYIGYMRIEYSWALELALQLIAKDNVKDGLGPNLIQKGDWVKFAQWWCNKCLIWCNSIIFELHPPLCLFFEKRMTKAEWFKNKSDPKIKSWGKRTPIMKVLKKAKPEFFSLSSNSPPHFL